MENGARYNLGSLDRPASTLSGGEKQRIRPANQIGSGLQGVLTCVSGVSGSGKK